MYGDIVNFSFIILIYAFIEIGCKIDSLLYSASKDIWWYSKQP
jgi:hypothetical protein